MDGFTYVLHLMVSGIFQVDKERRYKTGPVLLYFEFSLVKFFQTK